jgi:hypothetical protein
MPIKHNIKRKNVPPHHKHVKKESQAKNKTAPTTTVVSQQER